MVKDYRFSDAALENGDKCCGVLLCCILTSLLQNVLKFLQFI